LRPGDLNLLKSSVLRQLCIALVTAQCALALTGGSKAQDRPPGITEPMVFPPYQSDLPACAAPPGLRKVLAFAQDNERDFMMGVRHGLSAAARDRGLEFRVAVGNNDPVKMIEQVDAFVADGVGAIVAAPVDPMSLSHSLQAMIWRGGYVGTVVPPPATSLLNAPQYRTGRVLGDAAANYIRTHLAGKANVVLLTHDGLQFLAPRFVAMRDALRNMPGVVIVADISPATVNTQGGAETMRTVLLAQPQIDVVLGADTVVLGALAELRNAGKARDNQFLGGIDGEPNAIAEIKKGGPYKASIGLASPIFSYAMGQHAANWLEGKSIPQAIEILPTTINAENVARYEDDLANPEAVYADPARREKYLNMYGNICYDTRDRYVNFPWSSERK
jgi:ribose transport system substrate-binding protein